MRIGVISDTHGLLHDVDHIVHAGDVGGDDIIDILKRIAPVTFVRGNNDDATGYDIARVELGSVRILVTHILPRAAAPGRHVREALRRTPADIVIFGHSHLPHDEVIDGVRFFNPASAGPRRFDYPISIGVIEDALTWHVPLDEQSVEALRHRMNQM
jgi:putative phosphoesterase